MADAKEQARLKMKADANFQRNLRFKDSRLRTIGVDVNALNMQVAEKKRIKEEEIEAAKIERMRNEEIESVLEAVAQEERHLRALQTADIKKGWDEQIKMKRQAKSDGRAKEIDDFHNVPTMQFAGEDRLHDERKKAQQEQMRRWTQEDIDMRAYNLAKEKEEDMARAELNRAIDEFREQQAREEAIMRKELTRQILAENSELAEIRAKLREEERSANDKDLNNSIVLDADAVLDENGYVVGKDGFRGYTPGQRRQILLENEELIRLKREQKEKERLEEENWYRESIRLQRVMAQAEVEERSMRAALQEEQMATLREQVHEKQERRNKEKEDLYGKISGDFYSKFGTSCR